MCGIAGMAGQGDSQVVQTMTRALAHRGPDDEGFYSGPAIALGHRRLSVIDIAAGTQPMIGPGETLALVYNGEIYNYRGLRRDAEARGYRFQTQSDTETILAFHALDGMAAVDRFEGMFAYGLWDTQDKSLVLVRDPVGIKPLYYMVLEGNLYFASEIGALLAVPGFRPSLDPEALDDYLSFLHTLPPRTFYQEIRELPPGHWARWKDGELRIERYWQLDMAVEERTPAQWEEGLRQILAETMEKHLVADVPVGAFLSGGLDSTAIVDAIAAGGRNLDTFTIGFGDEGARYDESEDAARIAAHYGARHHHLKVDADLVGLLDGVVAGFGEPFANPMALLTHALSGVVREHVKVILSGDGGDECFGGYPRYQGLIAAQLYRQVPVPMRRVVNRIVQLLPEDTSGAHARRRIREFSAGSLLPPMDMYAYWLSYFTGPERAALYHPDRAEALQGRDSLDAIRTLAMEAGPVDDVSKALYIDAHTFLPHNVLRCNDRMSMAHGLEVRVPFSDHQLLQWMGRVPSALKVRLRENKVLLRRYLNGRVPPEVLTRPKRGFAPPMGAWLAGPLAPMLDEYLDEGAIRRGGYFDPGTVTALRQAHKSGRRDFTWQLWALVVFEHWRRSGAQPL